MSHIIPWLSCPSCFSSYFAYAPSQSSNDSANLSEAYFISYCFDVALPMMMAWNLCVCVCARVLLMSRIKTWETSMPMFSKF
jgi:hypothetical protein